MKKIRTLSVQAQKFTIAATKNLAPTSAVKKMSEKLEPGGGGIAIRYGDLRSSIIKPLLLTEIVSAAAFLTTDTTGPAT